MSRWARSPETMPVSPARAAAFDIVLRVQQQRAYASELLHSTRLEKLSSVDRSLATEIVMGTLRWQSRLDGAIANVSSRPIAKLDAEVLVALRIAAYQLMFLTRIPVHAAIDESVELVKRARKKSAAPFANALLRRLTEGGASATREELPANSPANLSSKFAHPEWLVRMWVERFGLEAARRICAYDQQAATTAIRVSDPAVVAELEDEGIALAPGKLLATARIVVRGDVTRTRLCHEGRVLIQDEASQLVALLVGTGRRILDCCAAPGSKTAVLAERNPDAQIVATELHARRAALLRQRVSAANVEVVTADATRLQMEEEFDRVLADVPCSGTGTLARNPEIKWRLRPEDLTDLHARQVALLQAVSERLAPGGRVVYSTCSLEPEENEAVVEEVLQSSGKFRLGYCRDELRRLSESGELAYASPDDLTSGPYLRTIPGLHPGDGFFAAIIERVS